MKKPIPLKDLDEYPKEVNEKTRKEIGHAQAEIKAGKFYTHEQVKKILGI